MINEIWTLSQPESNDSVQYTTPVTLMTNMTAGLDNKTTQRGGAQLEEFQVPITTSVLVTVSYITIFLFGLVGNFLVILVICRNKEMRSSTNFFLLNLSIADLFVLVICMPSALLEFHSKDIWYLGEAMCKLVPYLENLSSHASVLTILAISFERYYAICHPFQAQYNCTTERSIKVILGIWVFTVAVCIPFLLTAKLKTETFIKTGESVLVCRSVAVTSSSRLFYTANIAVFFFIPVVVLILLYSLIISKLFSDAQQTLQGDINGSSTIRTRRQVVYMLISIIVLFVSCMLPFRVLSIYMMYTPMGKILRNVGPYNMLYLVVFSRIMFYLNSAGNFIVYNVLSSKFREAFRKVICPTTYKIRLERRMTLTSYYSSGARVTYFERDADEASIVINSQRLSKSHVYEMDDSSPPGIS